MQQAGLVTPPQDLTGMQESPPALPWEEQGWGKREVGSSHKAAACRTF